MKDVPEGLHLERETRWTRTYRIGEKNSFLIESRFMDGSASISIEELESSWESWPDHVKLDFCQSLSFLKDPLKIDVLRFIMKNGDDILWSAVALGIAVHLPASEAVPFLLASAENSELDEGDNFYQALSKTEYSEKIPCLKRRLERLQATGEIDLEGERGFNFVALEAQSVLRDMLESGEPAGGYAHLYDGFNNHKSQLVRTRTKNLLEKYFQRE